MARKGLFLVLLFFVLCTESVFSSELKYVDRSESDVVLFQLMLGRQQLNDVVVCYLDKGDLLIPLSELFSAVGYAISVDTEAGLVEGFYLKKENRFSLNLVSHELYQKDAIKKLNGRGYELHLDDVYVSAWLLEQWFPLRFDVRFNSLQIFVNPIEPLPMQEKIQRMEKNRYLQKLVRREKLPRYKAPYQAFTFPLVDASFTTSYAPKVGVMSNRYSALVANDLLYAESTLYVSGAEGEQPEELRYHLSRKSEDNALFSADFELGDVKENGVELIFNSLKGVGVVLSSPDSLKGGAFYTQLLNGEALPGSDAELYVNGLLADYVVVGDDGEYEFSNIPLTYGENIMQIVVYDPFGRKYTYSKKYFIGQEQLRNQAVSYRLGYVRAGEKLYSAVDTGLNEESSEAHAFFEFEHGVGHYASLMYGAGLVPVDGEEHSYKFFGINGSYMSHYHGAYFVEDDLGGEAFRYAIKGGKKSIGYNFRGEVFSGFKSEKVMPIEGSFPEWRVNGDVNFSLQSEKFPTFYSSISLDRVAYQGRGYVEGFGWRVATKISGFSLNNSIRYVDDQAREGDGDLLGAFHVSGSGDDYSLKMAFNYDLGGQENIRSINFTSEKVWREKRLMFNGKYDYDVVTSAEKYVLGVVKSIHTSSYSAGGNVSYADLVGVTLNIGLSFSFDGSAGQSRPWFVSNKIARNGALFANVCEDLDADRDCTDKDRPLSNVVVKANRYKRIYSNDDGVLGVDAVSPNRPVVLELDEGSIDNPDLISTRGRMEAVSRPGVVSVIDFPLIASGEVDGTVYAYNKEGVNKVLSNVKVQAVDDRGNVVQMVETVYDGFYLFTRLPYGVYTIRVAPEQLERFDLQAVEERVTIGKDESIISGVDVVLKRKQ